MIYAVAVRFDDAVGLLEGETQTDVLRQAMEDGDGAQIVSWHRDHGDALQALEAEREDRWSPPEAEPHSKRGTR